MMEVERKIPTAEDVTAAKERVAPYVHRTPQVTCAGIDRIASARLMFKCENLQKAGAFKFRGACNAVFSLDDDEAQRGVATHSSGNHAGALALAAGMRGVPAHVVMPDNSARPKVEAVRSYGGRITECSSRVKDRARVVEGVLEETGATFVHPSDDPRVIAGQATAALELMEDAGEPDVIVAPVGGGGLLSGTALAARHFSKNVRVIGAEPVGADDAKRSLQEGRIVPSVNPLTIADGLLTSLGDNTFPIIRDNVDDIVTVSEEAIVRAMRLLMARAKLVVEPSGAVSLAAVLEAPEVFSGKRVGVIVSGGNLDLERLPW